MNQEEIEVMCEALRAQGLTWSQTSFAISLVRNAIDAVKSERDALRKDAERYRWLRLRLHVRPTKAMSGSVRPALDVNIGCSFLDSRLPSCYPNDGPEKRSKELDSAIDTALQEPKP